MLYSGENEYKMAKNESRARFGDTFRFVEIP